MTDELLNYVLSAVDLTETLRNLIKSTYSAINNYLNSQLTLKFLKGGSVDAYETFPSYASLYKYLEKTKRNSSDYDYVSAYSDPEVFQEWYARELRNPGVEHFDGRYKLPVHMTYPGNDGLAWKEENGVWHYYVPEDHLEGGKYGHSFDEYVDYWNQWEPESVLHYDNRVYKKFANGGSVQDTEEANITIGGKSYTVEIVDTPEDLLKGLKDRESLAKNKGMLFDFNESGNHEMWMKDTLIPLDLIFLNEDLEVLKVVTREPKDETLIGCNGTWYVLEVNANSGIKKGDTLDFEDEQQEDWVMQVLAPDGSSLMNLKGGERIVSRRETKVLIRKAKKANKRKTDGAYASLGKYMFKILEGQDTRDPEYVKAPTQS